MFVRSLIIFICFCQITFAHELKPSIANLNFNQTNSETNVKISMQFNLEAILANISPNHSNTDDSENAKIYNQLRLLSPQEIINQFNLIKLDFINNILFLEKEKKIQLKVINILVPPVGDINLSRDTTIELIGNVNSNSQFQFKWKADYGPIIVRVNYNDKEIITKYLATKNSIAYFSLQRPQKQTLFGVVKDYVTIGFLHIVPKGLDHILFIIGLFLLSTRWKALIWQVSAFTLAHTVTIFLGALNIIQISNSIVEPIIALSITYVAIENIFFTKLTKWRPGVVFLFGLLHGLGFAGILNEIGVPESYFIASLISFNIGVELGQIGILILCFLTIGYWLGNKSWYRSNVTTPLSMIIAIIGLFWFLQRISFI